MIVVAEPKISSLVFCSHFMLPSNQHWTFLGWRAHFILSQRSLARAAAISCNGGGGWQPEDETNNIINSWRVQGPYLITWSRICSVRMIRNIVCFHYSAPELPIWVYTSSRKSPSPQWNAWPLADIMLIPEQIALLLEAGGDGSCDLVFREAIVGGNSICTDLPLE